MTRAVKLSGLQTRTIALRDRAIRLARDIEARFGKENDITIFARNAYCELHEVSNMLTDAGRLALKDEGE